MIEPIMFVGIGFLLAGLLVIGVIPLVHARAVRLTTRRLEALNPLSITEIQADKDLCEPNSPCRPTGSKARRGDQGEGHRPPHRARQEKRCHRPPQARAQRKDCRAPCSRSEGKAAG